MTLPKNLQEKRDELAKDWTRGWNPLADSENSVIALNYKKGFNDCANLLLPEIKKLEETLEWYGKDGEGPYSDARLYLKAQAALNEIEKWENK